MQANSEFMTIMQERGFISDCTDFDAVDAILKNSGVKAYIGFDATASSLHVGSLIQIMMLRWFQKTGHHPIVLLGGATTQVGDPTDRKDERPMLSKAQINSNISGIRKVFGSYLTDAHIVNNADWLDDVNYLQFLREVGKYFSVNKMLSYESVKKRLEDEQSLSFLEFNYMIMQAYDFLMLNITHGCVLQMGGSDQWGNIINGIDLVRKHCGNSVYRDSSVYGLTTPLLAMSNGEKMGKSAGNAIWLDPEMTSPYDFWQFWRNIPDADVTRFLKLYTELPIDECEQLGSVTGQELNKSKIRLANEVTTLLHGKEAALNAEKTAHDVFVYGGIGDDLPTFYLTESDIENGITTSQLFVLCGLAKSNKEAKRAISSGGAKINGEVIDSSHIVNTFSEPMKLSIGKKRHAIITMK